MARSGDTRICVIHKNVPAVISRITSIVSEDGINIENMLNKSRNEIAYTMLDISESDEAKINNMVGEFEALGDVIRVRVI